MLATISSKDKNSSFFLLGLLAIKSISQKYLFKFICWKVKKDQVKTALSHLLYPLRLYAAFNWNNVRQKKKRLNVGKMLGVCQHD